MIRLMLLLALLASAATKKMPDIPVEEPEETVEEDPSAKEASPVIGDKTRLEAYLRGRTEKIMEMHRAQLKFMGDEAELWNKFWGKMKDDRTRFEVHMARQRLNLFESLSSLDPKDHGASITDFEKLQTKLVTSFELTQKQKVTEFFAGRDVRVQAFALQQEKERAKMVADAEAAWRDQKGKLREEEALNKAAFKKKP